MDASTWVRTELESVDFGDERLNKRASKIMEFFSAHPQDSIPQATGTWADAKATYRFINNPKVTPEKILRPHQEASQSRIRKHAVVLAVQDTTDLNYTAHPATEGLGTIGYRSASRGMHVHTTIAYTPERVPLGVIHQRSWIRPEEEFGKKVKRKEKPIEEKESIKWLLSLEATEAIQEENPDVILVNIGDREADIYDLFKYADGLKSRLLVRGSWDRRVEHDQNHLLPHVEAQPVAETRYMLVPHKKSKKLREATVELRFAPVTICAPTRRRDKEPSVDIYAVYLNEPDPPEGVEPLSWLLLTTLKVTKAEEAWTVVEYYVARWSIEVFHRILKSGCRIEKRQLQTAERLRKCLALDSLVAWRIQLLTMLGRQVPDLPCDVVFEEHEWKALYCFVHKTTEPPATPPPLAEAVLLVARIGGFLARKSDGHPGTTVLWRGLQQLTTISFAWFAFGPGRSPP
ncbi:MAG: IS4 family transposase [Planctomycetota bacterium]